MDFWAGFWNVIWFFVWGFVFVAYLFALFSVIVDLFRDRAMRGWAKALWIVGLVFIPFLTVLAYVIARGDSMAVRSAKEQRSAQAAAETFIRDVAGTSPAEEIRTAKALLDAGTITPEEFETLKTRALLGRDGAAAPRQHDGSPVRTAG
ncbi:SHOCT domain-containing protein [Amnibacterium kyonggiense]|uniref:Phospholipase D-like protein n=1 Tax=Amnibacterium kyonggiense TaxID=595671 RepID=A0A4R7FSU2_9MICO|nr:SHOCT domain-containing protein [Amnibacterium kyonggiense]TDS80941.1 phospholipase D-like protein [Amnibacterium kyonggiense]